MTDLAEQVAWACPRCASPLPSATSNVQHCDLCGLTFKRQGGIYRFLLPERLAEIQPFLAQYRRVREQDGYRSRPAEYYRALPHVQAGDPQADLWRVRQASFATLCRLLPPSPMVLDLGAGNGWLSHRLTTWGAKCVAVDWLDDEDGLGAAHHYPVTMVCVQADFNGLPFQSAQFDVVIFNASLHYAPDITATLRNLTRLIKPKGQLMIMDSPTFQKMEDGQRMVAEQETLFKTKYGLTEVVRVGVGYVTPDRLVETGRSFRFYPSRGSWGWELRRRWAALRLRRAPARFGVWVGEPVC